MSFPSSSAGIEAGWPLWLISRFGDRPVLIAAELGCTRQQARNWLEGVSLPSARILARALTRWPEDAAQILGEPE